MKKTVKIIIIAAVMILILSVTGMVLGFLSAMQNKVIAYEIPAEGEVLIKKDIVYKRTDKRDLLMDVYSPDDIPEGETLPVIVMVHGDSLSAITPNPKDWSIFTSYGMLFAKSGYIGIAFTHRMLD